MGFLSKWRDDRETKKAVAAHEAELAEWQDNHDHVDDLLTMATNLDQVFEQSAELDVPVRLRSGEHILLYLPGAGGMVEPRVTAGQYQGGSTGVSFRVMKGVSYRVGQHKGTYVAGPEEQKIIDSGGDLYITTQRVLYVSNTRNRDWDFSKIVSTSQVDLPNEFSVTYINVSNRQKVSGVVYPDSVSRRFDDRLTLALAVHDRQVDTLVVELKEQQAELEASKPSPPAIG